jgi:hypothetical protein
LHLELKWHPLAATARQVELPLILDLAIVGCEVVQPVARSIDLAQLVLREGPWVADVVDGTRID